MSHHSTPSSLRPKSSTMLSARHLNGKCIVVHPRTSRPAMVHPVIVDSSVICMCLWGGRSPIRSNVRTRGRTRRGWTRGHDPAAVRPSSLSRCPGTQRGLGRDRVALEPTGARPARRRRGGLTIDGDPLPPGEPSRRPGRPDSRLSIRVSAQPVFTRLDHLVRASAGAGPQTRTIRETPRPAQVTARP